MTRWAMIRRIRAHISLTGTQFLPIHLHTGSERTSEREKFNSCGKTSGEKRQVRERRKMPVLAKLVELLGMNWRSLVDTSQQDLGSWEVLWGHHKTLEGKTDQSWDSSAPRFTRASTLNCWVLLVQDHPTSSYIQKNRYMLKTKEAEEH